MSIDLGTVSQVSPPSPDCADSHGLVEAQEADAQVEEEQHALGLLGEAVDGGADVDQGAQGLREPDAEEVHLEECVVGHPAAPVTHEEVVEGGADPGGETGGHVGPGEHRHPDTGPGQEPGDGGGDEEDGQGVGEDVEALIVPVGQGGHAPGHVQRGPVVGPHVLVESGAWQTSIFSRHALLRRWL